MLVNLIRRSCHHALRSSCRKFAYLVLYFYCFVALSVVMAWLTFVGTLDLTFFLHLFWTLTFIAFFTLASWWPIMPRFWTYSVHSEVSSSFFCGLSMSPGVELLINGMSRMTCTTISSQLLMLAFLLFFGLLFHLKLSALLIFTLHLLVGQFFKKLLIIWPQ